MEIKYAIRSSCFFLLSLFAFVACQDEDDADFLGGDNYITSFKIAVGETIYKAAICGDSIILTVPEGTSFEGARAEIDLSEHASILPDLTTITHWGEEYQLIVSSYNQADRIYKYVIRYTPVSVGGNIELATQADVVAFAEKGVSIIDGNLILGRSSGADSIFDLKPLSSLKEVKYNLVIQKNVAVKNLVGLENLERVGGLTIVSVDSLTDIELPVLEKIGTELNVSGSSVMSVVFPALKFIGGAGTIACPNVLRHDLAALEEVGSGLTLKGASTNISESLSLPKLARMGGALSIDSWGKVESIDLPELETCGGMTFLSLPCIERISIPSLSVCTGKMMFNSSTVLRSVSCPELKETTGLSFSNCKAVESIEFPALTVVSGDLSFDTMPLSDLSGLKALRQVSGKLNLKALNRLVSLSGLSALETVGTYTLYNLPELVTVDVTGIRIERLELMGSTLMAKIIGDRQFDGILYINDASNRNITEFPELEGFDNVGTLDIYQISSLTELSIPMTRIRELNISSGSRVITCSAPNLTHVGTLKVSYLNALENFHMPELIQVENDVSLTFPSSKITTLEWPKLESIGGRLVIQQGLGLTAIRFPQLVKIGGVLSLEGSRYAQNAVLTNLDGFATLKDVAGVKISYYTALVSFEGLKQAVSVLEKDWSVSNCGYNPTLEQMKNGAWNRP